MPIENNFVRTPSVITETLLRYETFNGVVLEPCCGDGAISEVLKLNRMKVVSSDKFEYGYGEKRDLFTITDSYDFIITNPPFTQQSAIKNHLLSITNKKLALLWYVKNLGREIESRTAKYLKTVYVFDKRIEWKEIKLGWLFAWYIYDKNHVGDTIIKKIKF